VTPRARTIAVALTLVALALAWEAFAVITGQALTWSALAWDLIKHPLIVLACGIVAGHFWWQRSTCAHCGFCPYHRDPLSSAAFDLALTRLAAALYRRHSAATRDVAKREAGLPVFSEVK
jgi:hypothetical protein